ncbi:hypothetical protein E3N88_09011 [Mikania micrantha]|uniref:Uncharacterized protein n=1 Tax=Mikania micrantha TaxID=192012 RepID=A0A5N6PKZ2_9ASTR|nr:hypothetical protein E3N88_09011 [Mikania micrantha]
MKMPQEFRAEVVRHSIYVLNQLPTKALKNQTPYEALKGNRPRIDHLKVFGCVGFVKHPHNSQRSSMIEVQLWFTWESNLEQRPIVSGIGAKVKNKATQNKLILCYTQTRPRKTKVLMQGKKKTLKPTAH